MNKKAIFILGAIFLLIAGTLGYIIYSRYQTDTQAETTNPNNTAGQNPTPTPAPPPVAPTERFFKLGQEVIVSPALLYNGSGVTYFDALGQVYVEDFVDNELGRVELDRKRKLDYPARSGIEKIIWPLAGPNFIAQINQDGKTFWSSFDAATKQYVDLPEEVKAVDFMPDGDKLLYVWVENGKATLNTANPDNTGWQQISEMWELDNSISISPDGKNILYFRTESTATSNPISLTTPDGKVWKSLVKDGYNKGVLWSPDGKKFMFGRRDDSYGKYELWFYDVLSDKATSLGVYTTVEKAVWDTNSRYVYVAVPNNGTSGAGLTEDVFYRIDLESDNLDRIEFDSANMPVDGRDLSVNGNGTRVFFKNAHDNMLYYVDVSE